MYYTTYAKGFRPGGYNPPLPPVFCGPGSDRTRAFRAEKSPATYNNDTTQSYEIGSKNNFANRFKIATSVYYIKWNNIQQNVYVAGNCGLQFTDNLGTAVAKGFDMQAEARIGEGLSRSKRRWATPTHASPRPLPATARSTAMRSQARRRSTTAPAPTRPGRSRSGRSMTFTLFEHDAFVRRRLGIHEPQSVARPGARSAQQSIRPELVHAARDEFHLGARRREVRRLAGLGVLRQFVRLAHRSSTTRRCRSTRFNPSYLANPLAAHQRAAEQFHLPPAHLRNHGDASRCELSGNDPVSGHRARRLDAPSHP